MRLGALPLVFSLVLAACGEPSPADVDADGFTADVDCDDGEAAVHPGASEVCNARDDDCDGQTDEAGAPGAPTWFNDRDGDGHGSSAETTVACAAPAGFLATGGDCNDTDPSVHPGASELPGDELDQDCDAQEVCFEDADGDGYRPEATSTVASADLDCRDPGEARSATPASDCDDGVAEINPDAEELAADGIDQNCDAREVCFLDGDADGFRPDAISTVASTDLDCVDPGEAVSSDPVTDCNDAEASSHPGASEIPGDGVDQDCDEQEVCFVDADDDGFRPDSSSTVASADTDCDDPGEAVSSDPDTDCDDGAPGINPEALEVVADGVDQNCDAQEACFPDADQDGFRPDTASTVSSTDLDCVDPGEAVSTVPATDCDDSQSEVHPGATEITGDGVDQDCDALEVCFLDADADGFRPDSTSTVASSDGDCGDPGEAVGSAPDTDCNDGAPETHPGAEERVGDGVDQNCDAQEVCFVDADGDGYRPDASSTVASADLDCDDPGEGGGSDPDTDCDDGSGAVNPGAPEVCGNGIDENCDGEDPAQCVLSHCGTITENETWRAADVHTVTCNVVVQDPSAPVLTVEDGAVVTFNTNTTLQVGMASPGRLQVDGAGSGVLFTSSSGTPAPGDWGGIVLGAQSDGSELHAATIEYAGRGRLGGLSIQSSAAVVSGSTFRFSESSGVHVTGSTLEVSDSQFTDNATDGLTIDQTGVLAAPLTGSVFARNGRYPVLLPAGAAAQLDTSSSFAGNLSDQIAISGGAVDQDGTWSNLGVPYRLLTTIAVGGPLAPVLTIEDGVVVEFAAARKLDVGLGSNPARLQVNGGVSGVRFTSAAAVPAPGDWGGLTLGPSSAGSVLIGTTIEYGGGGGLSNLTVQDPASITASTFRHSAGSGVRVIGLGATLTATDSQFIDNAGDGLAITSSGALAGRLLGSTLSGNGRPALVPAASVGQLDASSTFTGNAVDVIAIGGGTVEQSATWSNLGVPFGVLSDVTVGGAAVPVLTIDDGTVLRFSLNARLAVGLASNEGRLEVNGGGAGVLFTSAAALPVPGDWEGITLGTGSDGSALVGATIEYGGGNLTSNLTVQGAASVTGGVFRFSETSGALVSGIGAALAVADAQFIDNVGDGLAFTASGALIGRLIGSTLAGNGGRPLLVPAVSAAQLDPSSTYAGNGEDVVAVTGGSIDKGGTWSSLDVPYRILTDITVGGAVDPVLTIEDGARISFASNAGLRFGVSASFPGKLQVNGLTAGVLFTSASTTPQPGDWDGITLGTASGGSELIGATIEYGGANTQGNLVVSSSASVRQSLFQQSSRSGANVLNGGSLLVDGVDFVSNLEQGLNIQEGGTLSGPVVNSVLTGNGGAPVRLPPNEAGRLDGSSLFSGNVLDAVELLGASVVSESATWANHGVPYRLLGGVSVYGPLDPVLSIGPQTRVEFAAGASLSIGSSSEDGGLLAAGSSTNPVVFTSASPTPAPGDWLGITFRSRCLDASSTLDHVVVEYGGATGTGNVTFNTCDGTVSNSLIQSSSTYGIYRAASTVTLSNVSYANNASGDLF